MMSLDGQLADNRCRTAETQARAAQACARLLALAEQRDSGQIQRIVRLLASTINGQAFPFDLYELRAVDVAISDDMPCCLDALPMSRPLSIAEANSKTSCEGRR